MSTPFTPKDLQTYLETHHISGEVIQLALPTPTVETAAEAIGCHTDQIIKTLLFMADERPVLVIASGPARIDRRTLARHFGINRRKMTLADADTVLDLTGYPVGAVPPLGHRQPLHTLIDPGVMAQTSVYGGGGSDTALVQLSPQDILAHTRAEIVPLQEEE